MANDLWSLACLLVWMLTGSEAFDFLGEEADVVHEFEEDAEWAQERHELWVSQPDMCHDTRANLPCSRKIVVVHAVLYQSCGHMAGLALPPSLPE